MSTAKSFLRGAYNFAAWRVRWLFRTSISYARRAYNFVAWRVIRAVRTTTAYGRRAMAFVSWRAKWALTVAARYTVNIPILGVLAKAMTQPVATWRTVQAYIGTHWPEVRGLERGALATAVVLLPFHARALSWVCKRAAAWRSLAKPRADDRSPRIALHVTGSFDIGGTQRQIANICTAPSRGGPFTHEATEIFHEHNLLYRHDVGLDHERYTGRGPIERAFGRLTRAIDWRSTQMVQIHKLRRDFRAIKPHVVIGWGHELAMLTFVAASLERVPYIVFCIRTFDPSHEWVNRQMANLLHASHRRMYPLLSGVIVNSTLLRENYAAWLGNRGEKIRICPNGIDPPEPADPAERARIRAGLGIPMDAVMLLNVGRFSKEKGQRTLVDANEILKKTLSGRSFFWLLIGDGPLLAELRNRVWESGVDNVLFGGRMSGVEDALRVADIFVMPSDFEGMPNAMMEAMSAGVACVSTRLSGARDVARENIETLYYEARAPEELATKLAHLIEAPDERRRLGEAAARRMKEFSTERMRQTFDSLLSEMTRSETMETVGGPLLKSPVGGTR